MEAPSEGKEQGWAVIVDLALLVTLLLMIRLSPSYMPLMTTMRMLAATTGALLEDTKVAVMGMDILYPLLFASRPPQA